MITHLYLVSSLRMREAIPPFPNTPTRRVQLQLNFFLRLKKAILRKSILKINVVDCITVVRFF